MSIYIVYAIQIALVVHVLKTGRDRYWIWLLIFLPLIAGAAYFLIEILPDLRGSIFGQRALRGVRKAIDPGGSIKHRAEAWEQSPNADNARRYGQALLEAGKPEQAMSVLDTALSGFFATEPTLLLLRAQVQFEMEKPQQAVDTLEQLQEHNKDFRSPEGHLLYARALEASGNLENALTEYRSVSTYFPGAEARYRLAMALKNSDHENKAQREFEQILQDAKLAPPHFRKSQKKWLDAARKALSEDSLS
jgi:hypothetical protein